MSIQGVKLNVRSTGGAVDLAEIVGLLERAGYQVGVVSIIRTHPCVKCGGAHPRLWKGLCAKHYQQQRRAGMAHETA